VFEDDRAGTAADKAQWLAEVDAVGDFDLNFRIISITPSMQE
jgi:hypothetical protein